MKEFVIRNSPSFGEIRLVAVNGEYHAVLSDIVQALGNQRNSNVTRNCKTSSNIRFQLTEEHR